MGVLEVLAFGEDVGGDKDVDGIVDRSCVFLIPWKLVALGREPARKRRGVFGATRGESDVADPGGLERFRDVDGGVGVLGEDEDFVALVLATE
jgi:hypothetical protein